MTCEKFDDFERGRIRPRAFARHARNCPECLREAGLDRRLEEEMKPLRTPLAAPELWARIESALKAEAAAAAEAKRGDRGPEPGRPGFRLRPGWRPVLIPAGAVLVLAAAVTLFIPRGAVSGSGLLARNALAEVQVREKEYQNSIDDLEKLARPKVTAMDLQLMSLYRDRLAVIDAQIGKCREALNQNPANAHLRRYLLAALRDKKETLAEVLGS